jgi:hypothetical protein
MEDAVALRRTQLAVTCSAMDMAPALLAGATGQM